MTFCQRVDSKINLLYKDSMHILSLDEVDNNAYVKPEYIACKEMNTMAAGAFNACRC
jgi:hypothetical protein